MNQASTVAFAPAGNDTDLTYVEQSSIILQEPADTLTVTTPAMDSIGVKDIVVMYESGPVTYPNAFTFYGPLAVSKTSPYVGPTSGGTTVTVTGSGFIPGQTTVTFGNDTGTNVQVAADQTSLTVTTPAGAAENLLVNVTVTTQGQTATQVTGGFLYRNLPMPLSTQASPASGPLTGGTQVTVTGSGFIPGTGNTSVMLGGQAGTNVQVASNGESLTFTTPSIAGEPGVYILFVSSPGGTDNSQSVLFYYSPVVPQVAAVSPASGPISGGTQVTLSGSGFVAGQTSVSLGGASPAVQVAADGNSLIFISPSIATPGEYDLTVTTPGGSDPNGQGFIYNPVVPTASNSSPTTGSASGGTLMSIAGSGFVAGQTSVSFMPEGHIVNSCPCYTGTDVQVSPDGKSLTVLTPIIPRGQGLVGTPMLVTVITPAGTSEPTPDTYTYKKATIAASGAPDSDQADTIVAKGETLSQVAADHHIAGGAAALFKANKSALTDPDTVVAGQQLRIDGAATHPASVSSITVTVHGKTIAQRTVSSFTGLTLRISDEPAGPTLTSYDEGLKTGRLLNESHEGVTITVTRPSAETTNQLTAGQTLALP